MRQTPSPYHPRRLFQQPARALTDGLKGEADLNSDGVIQFEELGVYIRNRVTAQAAQGQVRQDPEFRVLDQYGSGRVLFVK